MASRTTNQAPKSASVKTESDPIPSKPLKQIIPKTTTDKIPQLTSQVVKKFVEKTEIKEDIKTIETTREKKTDDSIYLANPFWIQEFKDMNFDQVLNCFKNNYTEHCNFAYERNDDYIFNCDYRFIKCRLNKWVENRNVNLDVSESMAKKYLNKLKVNFVLHLAFIDDNKDKKLQCYDGNHRLEALNIIFEHQIKIKIDKPILITFHLAYYKTEKDVQTDYLNLNKSVPVSINCKIGRVEIDRKIDTLTDKYCKKFRDSLFKPSLNPQKPNFNRVMLKSAIEEIEKDYPNIDIDKIEKALIYLNNFYHNFYHSKDDTINLREPHYKINPVSKAMDNLPKREFSCKTYDLWLFLSGNININHLKEVIDLYLD